ncbi:MAG: baseplate J/gp47 family protein [Lentisphaeria bacterium]
MARFTIKRQEQILAGMIAKLVARTRLSDVADSAAVKHLLAASARALDELYYQVGLLRELFDLDKAVGDDLDARVREISNGEIVRVQAVKASGNLVFSRRGVIGVTTIAAGTRVRTASGVYFVTTAIGQITALSPEQIPGHGVGRDSGLVPAVAEVAGLDGNVDPNMLVAFASKPAGVDEVTNPSATVLGENAESDDSLRSRVRTYIASLGRSTLGALESWVLGATTGEGAVVRYAHAVEYPETPGYVDLYVDDGTGSAESSDSVVGEVMTEGLGGPPGGDGAVGGEVTLFLDHPAVKDSVAPVLTSTTRGVLVRDVGAGGDFWLNPASGQVDFDPPLVNGEQVLANYTFYTGLIALAQKIVDGDPLDRVNYPGVRAAGVMVTVGVPQVLIQNMEVLLTIREGYDDTEVRTNVQDALVSYVNSLGISGDVLLAEIMAKAMGIRGVANVRIVAPIADVILLDDQLARTTPVNVVVS